MHQVVFWEFKLKIYIEKRVMKITQIYLIKIVFFHLSYFHYYCSRSINSVFI